MTVGMISECPWKLRRMIHDFGDHIRQAHWKLRVGVLAFFNSFSSTGSRYEEKSVYVLNFTRYKNLLSYLLHECHITRKKVNRLVQVVLLCYLQRFFMGTPSNFGDFRLLSSFQLCA